MGKTYKIAVLGGDGTGPEVTREAVKVLEVAARKFGFTLQLNAYDWGGDRYLKTGEVLPANAAEEMLRHDAILLGAIGHPEVKPGILEKGILLALRFALDQYINLRPVKLYPLVLIVATVVPSYTLLLAITPLTVNPAAVMFAANPAG